jgi:hypothetical protein
VYKNIVNSKLHVGDLFSCKGGGGLGNFYSYTQGKTNYSWDILKIFENKQS